MEDIGGLRPPFFELRTPMRSIGYGNFVPARRKSERKREE
jgi:hypothetical protein